ncbi:MAG: polysaccharide deacetylase family protein [Nitrospirae bacterium]|nr:polysaccharide deacetylase family protein [Nitrospirota bacterium]
MNRDAQRPADSPIRQSHAITVTVRELERQRQAAEKVRQHRSRIVQILNVPLRVRLRSSLAAALLDGHFEQPAGSGILATMPRYFPHMLCLILAVLLVPAAPVFTQAQVVKSGPPSCPGVALTFDLCPVRNGGGYDQELIDYLIAQKIPATFFMSGKWITKHDRQVKALLQVPFFEVGTHGEVHAHMPFQSAGEQEQEILGPVRLLKTKYHHDATLFRPPYGEFNDDTVNVTRALGLQFILWNVVSGDPDPTLTAIQIEGRLKRFVRKGSVIVMHANGKGQHTHEVVQDLHQHLLPERHLIPMTVSDLLNCSQAAP